MTAISVASASGSYRTVIQGLMALATDVERIEPIPTDIDEKVLRRLIELAPEYVAAAATKGQQVYRLTIDGVDGPVFVLDVDEIHEDWELAALCDIYGERGHLVFGATFFGDQIVRQLASENGSMVFLAMPVPADRQGRHLDRLKAQAQADARVSVVELPGPEGASQKLVHMLGEAPRIRPNQEIVLAAERAEAKLPALINGAAPSNRGDVDPVALGRDAWARVKANANRSWEDWMAIGEALLVGRAHAMNLAGKNEPRGKLYNVAFSNWLQLHGFDDIDGSDRGKLMKIAEHRADYEVWRAGWTPAQRALWKSPSTIVRISNCDTRGFDAPWKRPRTRVRAAKERQEETTALRQAGPPMKEPGQVINEAGKLAGRVQDFLKQLRKFRGEANPAADAHLMDMAEALEDCAAELRKITSRSEIAPEDVA